MEHVVIFVCIWMQLQTVLCYTYDMIFITELLKSNKLYIALQSVPQWKFRAHTWFQRLNMIKWMILSEISNKLQKCKCCSSIWCPTFRDWYWFVVNLNIFMEVNSAKKLSNFLKSEELYDCRFLFVHWGNSENNSLRRACLWASIWALYLQIQRRNGNSLNTAFVCLLLRCITVLMYN